MILIGRVVITEDAGRKGETAGRLQSVVDRINREGRSLAFPFRVTEAGEEFIAVYRDAGYLFDHIWLILYELYPVRVQFSIGVGRNTSGEKEEMFDGPAFRWAIQGSEKLKRDGHLFRVSGYPGNEQKLINYSLSLISERMVKWNKKRFAVLYALSRNREVGEVARLLDISERSVYKNINAGSLDTVLGTVREISTFLDR